jgi:hypothetical protein
MLECMFKKLDIKLPTVYLNFLQGPGANVGDLSTEFREYLIKDSAYLNYLFRDRIKFNILPNRSNVTIIEKNGALDPHTDVWATALNFYLDITGSEVTKFYANPSNHKIIVEEVPGLFFYDTNLLTEIGNFTAQTHDCYLLDTHVPHSVSNDNNGSRTILRLIWQDHSFQTVLDNIEIL